MGQTGGKKKKKKKALKTPCLRFHEDVEKTVKFSNLDVRRGQWAVKLDEIAQEVNTDEQSKYLMP